jgi:hypothetical protein
VDRLRLELLVDERVDAYRGDPGVLAGSGPPREAVQDVRDQIDLL